MAPLTAVQDCPSFDVSICVQVLSMFWCSEHPAEDQIRSRKSPRVAKAKVEGHICGSGGSNYVATCRHLETNHRQVTALVDVQIKMPVLVWAVSYDEGVMVTK